MKTKQLFLSLLVLLTSNSAYAYDFELNGIYYNTTVQNTVEVTYVGNGSGNADFYYGDVIIPQSIVRNGVTYSVTSIGEYAFQGCSGLTSIEIPNSVTSIGYRAFVDCSGLTSIEIPNSVTSIGSRAFAWCPSLTSIVVNSGNSTFDSRNDCNAIIETASNKLIVGCKTTVIPNSVTSIGDDAFRGSGLTSIEIPNSVTSIAGYAFAGCRGLTSIVIPNSVTSIGLEAFYNCSSLTSVFVKWNAPLENLQLYGVARNQVTLYVPAGCKAAYEAAEYWKDFKEIVEMNITFADEAVKAICVRNWDTDGDGELSPAEASAVTSLSTVFKSNTRITSFDELRYFTGLTRIADYAFAGCRGLTSIVIPNSVTSIGRSAFSSCSGLTSIEIPNSVTSIADGAFSGCSGLTSIVIPNSVTNIVHGAFYGCSGLTSIVVNSGNSTFDSRNDCNAIIETASNKLIVGCKTTVIPNTVTSIGYGAFGGCSGLTSIVIPNSVTSIVQDAFSGCSGLTSIVIPNSVTSIVHGAFYGCSGLTSIVVNSGNSTFDSRNDCNAIIETASNKLIVGCKTTVIPNTVTSIGQDAFSGCSGLTSIVIPNSVTSIGICAFYYCSGLTSIVIPNSVTSIGNGAFSGCSGLTSIEIPNSVTTIGNSAFYGCSGLTSIEIPNSVTSIGNGAFDGCSGLTSVTVDLKTPLFINWSTFTNRANATLYVPAGCKAAYEAAEYWKDFKEIREFISAISFADGNVKAICVANWDTNGDGELDEDEAAAVTELGQVFRDNANITSFDELRYFTGLTSIGNGAFDGCSGLTSIEIPNSVTSIGEYAFSGCRGLTSIEIPNSVTSIGDYAFSGCSGLTSIEIPNSVTSIAERAFYNCSGLTSIVVNSGNSTFDSRNDCNAIIETASNKLIVGCKTTVIPNSVTSIGKYAFAHCSGLTEIVIPNSVTSIADYAFYKCSGLTSVTVDLKTPLFINWSTFTNRANATLYVPAGCKAAYEAAEYWKDFKEIVEMTAPDTDITEMDNVIYVEAVDGFAGGTVKLDIKVKNVLSPVGCSFKLTLPDGFTLEKDADGDVVYVLGDRARKMSLTMQDWNNGAYDCALTPTTATAGINGSDGAILTFSVRVPDNATAGEFKMHLTRNLIQTKTEGSVRDNVLPDVQTTLTIHDCIPGDVNDDGSVTPSDAIMILYRYFGVEQSGFKQIAADVNSDNNISPADAIEVLYKYFASTQANAPAMTVDTLDPQ